VVSLAAVAPRFAIAFGAAFPLCYAAARAWELALFTVFPTLGIVLAGTHRARDSVAPSMAFLAPGMYWYGWVGTAAIGASVVALLAALVPAPWCSRCWAVLVCATPVVAMAICVYLEMPWFRL